MQSKRGSMEEPESDRLSSLPDDVLHAILRLLPLKHAARTSALSRRWAPQWLRALASSRVLDLTDPDFARGQLHFTAATVRRCLELHAAHGAPLDALRVALPSPPAATGAFARDVAGWVAHAVASGATEVEVRLTPAPAPTLTPAQTLRRLRARRRRRRHVPDDAGADESTAFLPLPGDLFVAGNSLARLALGGFSLRAIRATFLAGIRSLSLSHVNLHEVSDVVSSCRALEHLRLSSSGAWPWDPDRYLAASDPDRYIAGSAWIRIASDTLRVLEMVACKAVRQVRVAAPALESVAFHDTEFFWSNEFQIAIFDPDFDDRIFVFDGDMPALRDVYLSRIWYHPDSNTTNYDSSLRYLERVPAWTICCDDYNLPLQLDRSNNIQELQVLIASRDHWSGELDLDIFFEESELPFLDRLFVRHPSHVTDGCDADAAAALAGEDVVVNDSEHEIHDNFVLGSLSFIKLINFRGTRLELQLLALLLKTAPALEHLVLVTVGGEEGAPGPGDEHLELIQRRVSAMHKASPHARLTVCRPCQDRSQNPLRTRFFEEE